MKNGVRMGEAEHTTNAVAVTAFGRMGMAVIVLGAMFFLPAGTANYIEAWIYMAILFLPMTAVLLYYLKKDPELLRRRMQIHEREKEQKRFVWISLLLFLLAFLLPGFDYRYGWTTVPPALVAVADLLVLGGYGIFVLVLRENRYASRIVEVADGQTVVDTGPYAVVRHPMYSGVIVLYLCSPVALGSFLAVIPAALLIPILILRIRNEEDVLSRGLPGYDAYKKRVRYRLFPGIW